MRRRITTAADWAGILAGDPAEGRRRAMDEMRAMTPADRAEAEAVERLLGETAAVRDEIRRAAEAVDWQALPALIADRTLAAEDGAARREAGAPVRLPWPAALRMRPVLAGLSAGLVVGAAAMYLALKAPGPRPGRNEAYYASGEFLDRAELEMARRGAVDYLEKSQYLLLDVFGPDETGPVAPASVRMAQARDLLQKKKYLNGQLERFQMAKAKALCDQIEMLFLELSQIDDELPAAELGRIRGFVEDRQLLLKINLVKKELESGV